MSGQAYELALSEDETIAIMKFCGREAFWWAATRSRCGSSSLRSSRGAARGRGHARFGFRGFPGCCQCVEHGVAVAG
jgi:hypothetical protein